MLGAFCQGSGLECQVVKGLRGSSDYWWNEVCLDGTWYHMDLMQDVMDQSGLRLRYDEDMTGYYWDTWKRILPARRRRRNRPRGRRTTPQAPDTPQSRRNRMRRRSRRGNAGQRGFETTTRHGNFK